jgi:hypothetical protein
MSILSRAAAAVAAAALTIVAAPPAFAASGVYGGSTSDQEAIVLTTDAAGKKLRSAVISWEAPCADGMSFPVAIKLTAVKAEPGFRPAPDDLVVGRNAKGRFSGTQFAGRSVGDDAALVTTQLSGRLRARSASGKLSATVSIVDGATGEEITTCETGSQSWSASRAARRVFGGSTSQEEPIVVRLDRKRKRVTDLITGWQSATCEPPDRYFRFALGFQQLRLRGARFGGTFEEPVQMDDGSSVTFTYDVSGSLKRRAMRGGLRVTVAGTDPAGAPNLSCDSGKVSWRAATG